jgi:hypothetical protein
LVKALAANRKVAGSILDEVIFKFTQSFLPHEALGFTQPLTEMSTRNIKIIIFLGSKVRQVSKADNLTAICEPIF